MGNNALADYNTTASKFRIGDVVYFSDRRNLHQNYTNVRGKVHHIFVGANDETYVIIETHDRRGKYGYHLDKEYLISRKKGVSLHELQMADPDRVRQIGIDAGIWDKDGKLMPAYRS